MSKQIKQMQMDVMKRAFADVRDMVLLNVNGLSALTENQMRLQLRQKNVRMQTVKNSLALRVFGELGIMGLDAHFTGPTTVAWGSASIADLSKLIDGYAKKNKKVQPKTAVADGAVVPFDAAKKFPTREEAIGRIIMLALSPAGRVAGMLKGPAGRVSGQIKSISEKKEEAPAGAANPA